LGFGFSEAIVKLVSSPDIPVNQAAKPLRESRKTALSAVKPSKKQPSSALQNALQADSFTATAFEEVLDRAFMTAIAPLTGGLSPAALLQVRQDWLLHLSMAPGKQRMLLRKAGRKWARLAHLAAQSATQEQACPPCIEPLAQDQRFKAEAWQKYPFNVIYQSFLLQQQWWHNATTGVPGVTSQHERVLAFTTRQMLDVFSPSNFLWSNPEALERTMAEGGQNLWRGAQNYVDDVQRIQAHQDLGGERQFDVGVDVAVTPGKVVYRNRLIELIQFEPSTETVHPEPILIVPAWINKYYILDLSPENSLVRYLTEQGFSVFIISWLNPGPADRDLGMDDYLKLGVQDSVEAIKTITGQSRMHGVGYCLGGTLLSIAAGAAAHHGDGPFESLSFFASQFDFSEPGELQLFINESQLYFLDSMMWEQGFLDAKQMSGAFQLLNSNDLIWSRNMRTYLFGERSDMNDLMSWNADSTRMPYKMHSEYLHKLYLKNDLAEGRFQVDNQPVALTDIRTPVFSVGTVKDHVAPWHSVYKAHRLLDTDITFVLTSGGHNAGIVSEPGHPRRSYQIATRLQDAKYIPADSWAEQTPRVEGSWWPAWSEWLSDRSGKRQPAPPMGSDELASGPLADAPGSYVLAR